MAGASAASGLKLGKVLRSARLEAELSVRDLAGRMEVSPATVSKAEAGRNPRRSTLNAYLQALPKLSAYSVLQASGHCAPAASAEVWSFYRDRFGLSAKSVFLEALPVRKGWMTSLEVRGVRSHRGSLKDPIERTALLRFISRASSWLAKELLSLEEEQPRGTVRFEEDGVEHEFRFPSALDRSGFSYTRSTLLTALPGAQRLGQSSPFEEGLSWETSLPTETLRLSLGHRSPGGMDLPRARVWVNGEAITPEDPDITAHIHPLGLGLRSIPGSPRSEFVLEQPLMNMSYGLGWAPRS